MHIEIETVRSTEMARSAFYASPRMWGACLYHAGEAHEG